jgi:WD40 repeat protein
MSAYDVRGGFTWLGDIEKAVPRIGQISTSTLSKIIERNMSSDSYGGHLINQFRPVTTLESKFSVFSLRGPNCVKQQLVEVKDNRLGLTPLTQFFIDDGKVSGFDIHPSNDYIMITSSKGKIYVFRIDTGELRGTIDVPLHAQGCLIDPSGLYVVVKVPPFSPLHTTNFTQQGDDFVNMGLNERDLSRTTILMYEVGTRRLAAEVHSIFDITSMNFSAEGRYLALGSQKGSVSVWALGDHMFRAVNEVVERMKIEKDFWCNYPIYLSDYINGRSQQQSYAGGVGSKSTLRTTQLQMQGAPSFNIQGEDVAQSLRHQPRNFSPGQI